MESQTDAALAASFEQGVTTYFAEFGHREGRESAHQAWLLMTVAQFISPQLIVAELGVPQHDLAHLAGLPGSSGGYSFDFAITRTEIDLHAWKRRTPGWRSGIPTAPQTLETLSQVSVVAELKMAESTSTSHGAIRKDLRKLAAVYRFLQIHNAKQLPACYMIIFDPKQSINEDALRAAQADTWPEDVPYPKILHGP